MAEDALRFRALASLASASGRNASKIVRKKQRARGDAGARRAQWRMGEAFRGGSISGEGNAEL